MGQITNLVFVACILIASVSSASLLDGIRDALSGFGNPTGKVTCGDVCYGPYSTFTCPSDSICAYDDRDNAYCAKSSACTATATTTTTPSCTSGYYCDHGHKLYRTISCEPVDLGACAGGCNEATGQCNPATTTTTILSCNDYSSVGTRCMLSPCSTYNDCSTTSACSCYSYACAGTCTTKATTTTYSTPAATTTTAAPSCASGYYCNGARRFYKTITCGSVDLGACANGCDAATGQCMAVPSTTTTTLSSSVAARNTECASRATSCTGCTTYLLCGWSATQRKCLSAGIPSSTTQSEDG
ncbi:MAG TPA: hypothetical protein VI979_01070, partial [archaeon]|nr:hypothetical protein [archaeon]